MKGSIVLQICLLFGLVACSAEKTERVEVELDEGYRVTFEAGVTSGKAGEKISPQMCVWKDKLFLYALQNPPWKYLRKGIIRIDGQDVYLDVSHLAMPWVEPTDMTSDDIHVERHELDDAPFYILRVYFRKGGANDYMVEWEIHKGRSVRTWIKSLGDGGEDM